ncbi:hypothetical protein PLICRDRAFT_35140 [Plicaturopsis crispa FD-325 SS-3]|nr:hypothetical protein PLICRDRAFT_35140 [Plicaturopsis crispa FD-325 SS-3]
MPDSRGVHTKPLPGTARYSHGKQQAEISIERYHILCAALKKQYTISSGAPAPLSRHGGFEFAIEPRGGQQPPSAVPSTGAETVHIDARVGKELYKNISFGPYKDARLPAIEGVKLHPRTDGSIHPEDLGGYTRGFKENWKVQEGGVMYALAESREFWNCMLNYHSPAGTTGIAEWDKLFYTLKTTGFPKNIVPCMFFGREAGCLDPDCPFLHDRDAVLASRERVLAARRKQFDYKRKPTPHQVMARQRLLLSRHAGTDHARRDAMLTSGWVDRETKGDKAYCANPECLEPWKESQEHSPLKACTGCKFTMYCSRECQVKDWKRHKKEPCAPIEKLVADDDMWNPFGMRKGTEALNVNWG